MNMQAYRQDRPFNIPAPPQADFIPKEHYICPEFNRLENVRLWQRVWQIACREEEIPQPGNFVRYDVADQSIVVLRGDDGVIRAFHNVCQHRGNRLLTAERGSITKFSCRFHGWQWGRDGSNIYIKDHEDWSGCQRMSAEDMRLKEVLADSWGGFIFINMDPAAEPLAKFLDPVPGYLDCLEFEKMRLKRHATVRLQAKWLTAVTSFTESYHVYTTHPHLQPYVDEISVGYARGRHGSHGYPNARPFGAPSARTGLPMPDDIREGYVRAMEGFSSPGDRTGVVSERSTRAVLRIMEEVPAGTPPEEVFRIAMQFMREAAEADGAGWPEITPEQMANLGVEWNIFPNIAMAMSLDAAVFFRARPDSLEVDSCLFDIWMLERVAPEKAPGVEHEFYPEWRPYQSSFPKLLVQDMRNIEQFQRGMSSIGFTGARTNPVQETQVFNLHRVLHEYVYGNST